MINGYLERLDEVGVHVQRAGKQADDYACKIIALLEEIRDATATGYDVDVFEYPRFDLLQAGSSPKIHEGREGYVKVVKSVAVISTPGANVDLAIGEPGAFFFRVTCPAAGRISPLVNLPIPEATPLYVSSDASAQVSLIVQRIKL